MAKNLILLCVLFLASSFSGGDILRTGVANSYTSQIGVREKTGHNDGLQVEAYLRSTGLGKGNPWCAAFVHWNLVRGGVPNTITAFSPTAVNRKALRWYKNKLLQEPQTADVFTIYYASLGRVGHTGFYHKRINRSFYETVEGNTSSGKIGVREGDGVYRRIRSYNTTYAISSWIGN